MHNFKDLLGNGIEELKLIGKENLLSKLLIYINILKKWNKKYNLTSLTKDEEIIKNHLLDSLSISKLIEQKKIIDVGSGAGFPGIILALYDQSRHVTLIDKVGKKTAFMKQVCLELELKNVSVIHSRVEELDHNNHYFDAVIARAFGDMSLLIKLTKRLIDKKGVWYGMKSKKIMEEDFIKQKYSYEIYDIKVPYLEADRYLVKIKNNEGVT